MTEKDKKLSPFDYAKNICEKTGEIPPDEIAESYNPWMVNRALSMYPDTVFYANEMNAAYDLPKNMQYDFLYYGINKKKRWAKWAKRDTSRDDKLDLVKRKYNYSTEKAEQVFDILDNIPGYWDELESEFEIGGAKKPRKKA